MGDDKLFLNGFEEIVLLAVLRLRDNAYGVTIRQAVDAATERTTSIGLIYTTLERLEVKGFVRSHQGDPTPERGGRAKRYFAITGAGAQALNDAQRARDVLRGRPQVARGAT
jgi:PadR family transcriptional regulator, regulatory protein PadR